ncbi:MULTISPECIES: metalloregulator ArsR/SmtB family transcription factor [unclassified Corynebacterium]|uniref:helix-turn-helix transcriptional regulator n=1 Tax=unclassified Corynebacterium TaxID=2624378 RepID=UPI0029CAA2C1|nr:MULTISPECIES: metalloregulator ArsR/SmtB family transcription factor [unclassified Corynebacterium]WPF65122.1 transcriptional regulator [Corynebacterium sp. 22KM0430]WPF67618.1 transcriptional regulator [Corynebacterium sp. 21KM1197]
MVRKASSTDGDTRNAIMRSLLTHGPLTAAALGERLGLSAAGVRRHLDILLEEGLAYAESRRPPAPATRGRPAKHFRLTQRGREHFGHDYDSLAALALAALSQTGGPQAVRDLARARTESIVAKVRESSTESIEETARALARAFDEHGYAATVQRAGGGIQICQHHCPVSQVAAQYPELCEAEHEVISELLGTHVQPLASIAEGHGICTTNIPLYPTNSPEERSGS